MKTYGKTPWMTVLQQTQGLRKYTGLACIYVIHNTVTKRNYVGSTIRDAWTRWREHVCDIAQQRPRGCVGLHQVNTQNMVFAILEFVTPQKHDVLTREQYWIDRLRAVTHGYNSAPVAGSCAGVVRGQEERQRRALAAKLSVRVQERIQQHREALASDPEYKARVIAGFFTQAGRQAHRQALKESSKVAAHMEHLNSDPRVISRRENYNSTEAGKDALIRWNKSDLARHKARERMLAINADPALKSRQMQGLVSGGYCGTPSTKKR